MSTQSWQERSLIRDGLLATSSCPSAVDLKFPSVVPQTRSWELQIQNRTRIIKLLVLLDSEVRMSAVPRCDANFGIGALGLPRAGSSPSVDRHRQAIARSHDLPIAVGLAAHHDHVDIRFREDRDQFVAGRLEIAGM